MSPPKSPLLLQVLLAWLFSKMDSASDQCAWYFVNFTIDTLIGVFIVWGLLKVMNRGGGDAGETRGGRGGAQGNRAVGRRVQGAGGSGCGGVG